MGGGFAGLALGSLLEDDGFFGDRLQAAETRSLEPREGHFPVKAKNVIFLMMNGAPSQVVTFDHKPDLRKYAGMPLPADKKYINSGNRKVGSLTPEFRPFKPGGESGLMISHFFPRVRKHADKMAIINS